MLEQKILTAKTEALTDIARAKNAEELFAVEKKYLGRKSAFNAILKGLKDLSGEEKRKIGPLAHAVKQEIENALSHARATFAAHYDSAKERIDVTAPGVKVRKGHLHVLSRVQRDIEEIFRSMGFGIADGPEVETEYYNFDALNVPKNHPARDLWDTFWLKGNGKERTLLRTHTSPVQVRYMETHTPPFRIIAPGRCFRHEATDATHEHTFNQFEALVVGDDVTIGNFIYIGEQFFSQFFKKKITVRLRPSFFPFVEPGFEFDISCTVCGGKKCAACKRTGWLEIGGAGMVNQSVFVAAGYSRNRYQGFAWGFGLERLALMKYKIDDIRLLHGGDLRFNRQF